ncbi:MAG: hypothetical protein JXA57_20035 [Armatimonadetes bacterium]|nr:hypothetical protein [Armatimonadota bacterium]
MTNAHGESAASILRGWAFYLLVVFGPAYVVLEIAEKGEQQGWGDLGVADWGALCASVAITLLYIASLAAPHVPVLRRLGVAATRLLLRIAATLSAILLVYAAVLEPRLALVLGFAGILYAWVRVLTWLSRTLPVLWHTVLFYCEFTPEANLEVAWDAVHGEDTEGEEGMLSLTEEGLRVAWQAGHTYNDTGYVVKLLPDVDIRIEAKINPLEYGAGWDPGLHFYRQGYISYCLSVGCIPEGHGPEGFKDISGVGVRTENPMQPVGWTEHHRHPVAPGSSITVSVEIRGQQCRVRCGDHSTELALACRPEELVVGAWKTNEEHLYASQNGVYVVRRVRIVRI